MLPKLAPLPHVFLFRLQQVIKYCQKKKKDYDSLFSFIIIFIDFFFYIIKQKAM